VSHLSAQQNYATINLAIPLAGPKKIPVLMHVFYFL